MRLFNPSFVVHLLCKDLHEGESINCELDGNTDLLKLKRAIGVLSSTGLFIDYEMSGNQLKLFKSPTPKTQDDLCFDDLKVKGAIEKYSDECTHKGLLDLTHLTKLAKSENLPKTKALKDCMYKLGYELVKRGKTKNSGQNKHYLYCKTDEEF